MPNYNVGELPSPDTNFTQITPHERPDVRASILKTAVKGATVAGQLQAKQNGAELTGADMSLEDANKQASFIDEQINAALNSEQNVLEGPLTKTRIEELKDKALSEFASNDRILVSLRDRGVISTVEARARRTLNLQRELSNPINALFKDQFLNAAGGLTGGSGSVVETLYQLTPEEARAATIQKEQDKAVAEHEGRIAGLVAMGIPENVARKELQNQQIDEMTKAQLDRLKTERALNGEEYAQYMDVTRNSSTRGVYALINQLNKANGGNGLSAEGITHINRTLDQQYRAMLEAINVSASDKGQYNIGEAEKKAERERLDQWYSGMKESVALWDQGSFDKKILENLDNLGQLYGYQYLPMWMFFGKINPTVLDIITKNGGLSPNLDQFTGAGTYSAALTIADKLKAATNLSEGKPPTSPDIAGAAIATITNGGSKEGLEYISSPEVRTNPDMQVNLKKIYDMAPSTSIQLYSTIDAQRTALQSKEFRQETNQAMSFARNKIDRVKSMIGAESEVIYAEPDIVTSGAPGISHINPRISLPRKSSGWILNLPNGMQEYASDLKAMYKFVQSHPWSWQHVKDQYLDATDAFNGYMRHEWDLNVDLNTESPQNRTPEELQKQKDEIKNRDRTSSGVRKPDTMMMSDAVKNTDKSYLSKKTTARSGEFTDEQLQYQDTIDYNSLPD